MSAVYRFSITFEDYDDIIREIDIKSNQTFADLHQAIHQSTGYNTEVRSSFYVSNDHWNKGKEIAYVPNLENNKGLSLMQETKLSSCIDDPRQKFYYTFNFDHPFYFHVELIGILDQTQGLTYPCIIKSIGEAPLQRVKTHATVPNAGQSTFDLLNTLTPKDATSEHLETIAHSMPTAMDEEEELFIDELPEQEHYGDDDYMAEKEE